MTDTTYQMLDEILRRAGAESDAAECHGALSGLASSEPEVGPDPWLAQALMELDPDNLPVSECRAALRQLYHSCRSDLNSDLLRFAPMLPDDSESLSVRASALGRWCQGYLFGLSLGGLPELSLLPPEVTEIISDFSALTRAGIDEREDEEESEIAYAELVEFIRVSVQLVREELDSLSGNQDPAPTVH